MLKELFELIKMFFRKIDTTKEEMEIKEFKHFPAPGYAAMMWCGYLIDKKDNYPVSDVIRNHEMIHYRQLCTFGSNFKYYTRYLFEWIKLGMIGNVPYYCNPMEIEAYVNEDNPDYKTYKGKYKKYVLKDARKKYCEHKTQWKKYLKEYFKDVR